MQELHINETEQISGGVVPLVAGAIAVGKALGAGFGLGVAVGSIAALYQMR